MGGGGAPRPAFIERRVNMANSIRVRSKTEYVIEVNDQGETISFDTADTSLTSRLFRMYEEIDRLTKEYEEKARQIDSRPDEPLSTAEILNADTGEFETRTLITKNQYQGAQLIDTFYTEARAALDKFIGPGACQKIFGDKNYLTMFNDLIEQLEPEFKKMGINAEKLKASAAAKHMPNREQRRALK